ncbi:MAG: class I SAM-dependent methyltransferase [Treponemataceae bacterium]
MSFLDNFRKPEGFLGKLVIAGMNSGHAKMAEWGFSHLEGKIFGRGLDIGCGGGANVQRLLERGCDTVAGVDYSPISVNHSSKQNRKAIAQGKCSIMQASVASLPFKDNEFNIATAFETVYFWPDIKASFKEVFRILKKDGTFFICNEVNGLDESDKKWSERIAGMNIYTGDELTAILKSVGFTRISTDSDKKLLCVTAQKG